MDVHIRFVENDRYREDGDIPYTVVVRQNRLNKIHQAKQATFSFPTPLFDRYDCYLITIY